MLNTFTIADTRQDMRFLIKPIGRDQDRHRLAYDLFGFVTKQALGCAIPGFDNPVQVLADDRVVR